MQEWQKKADIIRALSLISTSEAGSGHPTSSLSAADLITVLFDKYLTYDLKNPGNEANDRFILSKGHASPLYYAAFALAGGIKREDLLTLRRFDSTLEGHPNPRFAFADVATGSLGQGLSIGAGIALYAKRTGIKNTVYVLLGDGELAEGQVWEACNFASLNALSNLVAIADINGLGQTGKTMFFDKTERYEERFRAFGFATKVIDGHNFEEIDQAFQEAHSSASQPFVIIARTIKGKGISFLEGSETYHGKVVKKEDVEKALGELGLNKTIVQDNEILLNLRKPQTTRKQNPSVLKLSVNPKYKIGEEVATREAFGAALGDVGENDALYAIDGDVKNSTYLEDFAEKYPQRFIQGYIAEQNMVSVGVGLSVMGKIPFIATFGAFLTRAYDQIRMGSLSRANIKLVGSHAGVSIGEDGPSQMALEDIAMIVPIPGSVVLQPADGVSCAKLILEMVKHRGISYLRVLRPKTPVLYENSDQFKIGGSRILRQSKSDILIVVASGITVHEALAAHEILLKEGTAITVIDAYSIKPFDKATLDFCLTSVKQRTVITVEDHYYSGGLGDMVLSEYSQDSMITIKKMGVYQIMQSGTKDELLNFAGINAVHIVDTVRKLM